MGWNSWNCWATAVDADKVRRAARAMVASGLADHGWSYINIDDTWQGRRDARSHALQPNAKFGDLGALASEVHALGLKIGIYSTPWITSYAGLPGGSSDQPAGDWDDSLKPFEKGRRFGKYSFAEADARQWAAWGIDYLKYDWRPNDLPHVREMSEALAHSGRSIIYSLSNAAPLGEAASWAKYANSWRTTGDIRDVWSEDLPNRRYFGVSEIGFAQDPWAAFAGPGHFNDPDMLVLGFVGWKAELHPTRLTPDEQQTHFSLWCLLSAPLLLGCDLERVDPATLALITNDEVLALDQDALAQQGVRMATDGGIDVYLKRLENGGWALGFFNRQNSSVDYTFGKLNRIGLSGGYHMRDPWRHRDLPDISDTSAALLPMQLPAHGVQLYVLSPSP
jgi:alpha-galactosidase